MPQPRFFASNSSAMTTFAIAPSAPAKTRARNWKITKQSAFGANAVAPVQSV
jgi:hypothetical protein